MLEIKNIVKDYGEGEFAVHALRGINLNFRQSEFVSILGQSGCGKTTLLNIIGGLDRYTSGDLIIDGISTRDYKDVDWDAYRNIRIGFIFQSYNLITHINIVDNVEMALTLSGVSAQERRAKAIKVLEDVGLKDQIYKKPNQLSGGQMQRVSIARALINNPHIILADEPTGALDSNTSLQIMDMLSEIAKDRLVIMVTHNPELAEKYSTRIVKLNDGEVIDDSNPYEIEEDANNKEVFSENVTPVILEENKEETKLDKKKKERKRVSEKKKSLAKTSMSFLTAIKLSFTNLMTKKGRTFLTSLAASIGIIGVALVLAVSNGFQKYIDTMQEDMMAGYPITISSSSINVGTIMSTMMGGESDLKDSQKYPTKNEVTQISTTKSLITMAESFKENILSEEYVAYLKEMDPSLYGSIYYSYGMGMNIIGKPNVNTFTAVKKTIEKMPGAGTYAGMIFKGDENSEYQNINNMSMLFSLSEMTGGEKFITSQYDCLYGSFPQNKSQIMLVVDEGNRISEFTFAALGLDKNRSYTFEEIINDANVNKMKVYANDEYYTYDSVENYYTKKDYEELYNSDAECVELELVGIFRRKQNVSYTTLSSGLRYTNELVEYILAKNMTSQVVEAQRQNDSSWVLWNDNGFPSSESDAIGSLFGAGASINSQKDALMVLGGINTPTSINIYPANFEAKEKIKAYLDKWNNDHSSLVEKSKQVTYTDMAAIIANLLSQMIRIITIALTCFSSVSLFVSSFMIAIITYVSVVERTKEIGILRALGARKIDISRVFNAETGIIGLAAGLIGVIFTYLVSIPINILVNWKAGMTLNLANLHPLAALGMIALSICLTLIAGIIPSRIAAKKDPVVALRTE